MRRGSRSILASALLAVGLSACAGAGPPVVPATPEARVARIEALTQSRDAARTRLLALIQQSAPTEPRAQKVDPELRTLATRLMGIDRELRAIHTAMTGDASEHAPGRPVVIERR